MWIGVHELEKVHGASNTQQERQPRHLMLIASLSYHESMCPLRQYICRPFHMDVVNSWSRCTCRTDRSHMTWAPDEITHPIICNLCAHQFEGLQTYCAHVRLTHLPFHHRRSERVDMPSLLDNSDATGNTQEMDTSGSQGCIKRDGSRGGEEPRRQLRRTVSRTRQGEAPSAEADDMQKQMQTHAEKVRQEGSGHTRGPPFVWAYLGLVKSLQERGNAVVATTVQGTATYGARLEPLSPTQNMRRGAILQAGQNVQSRHQENHAEHRVPEKRLLVLEASSQLEAERKYGRFPPLPLSTEAERKYGRAPPPAMERERQTFLEDLLKT